MKAYVLYGIGDLRYEDRPVPKIAPGWALIKVLAAGICSSDVPRIFEKGTYRFPTIPGHEFCGIVEMVADKENEKWLGKRVGVFPLIPCKKCSSCQKGQYETCRDYDYIGSRRDGAFSEYLVAPVWNLIALPDSISNMQGAVLEPAAVALHAIKRLGVLSGKSVCIIGTGAVGILAAQWSKALGANRIVVKGRGEQKRQIVEQCGLEYVPRCEERFDCVVEAAGTNQALVDCLGLADGGGRIILLGNPSSDIKLLQALYWKILRKQLTISGSWNSSYGYSGDDWQNAIQAMASGSLRIEPLVTHIFTLDELREGLRVIRDKAEPFCKIGITIG